MMDNSLLLMLMALTILLFSGCSKEINVPPAVKVHAEKKGHIVTMSDKEFAKCVATNKALRRCCVHQGNR